MVPNYMTHLFLAVLLIASGAPTTEALTHYGSNNLKQNIAITAPGTWHTSDQTQSDRIASSSRGLVTSGVSDEAGVVSDAADHTSGLADVSSNNTRGPFDAINDAIDNAANTIGNVADAVSGAVSGAVDSVTGAVGLSTSVPLGGNSAETIVWAFIYACCVLIVCGIILPLLIAPCCKSCYGEPPEGRPSSVVIGLMVSSYALLIPALTTTLFSFTIAVHVLGLNYIVTTVHGEGAPITESVFSVIKLLLDTGGWLGAILVTLFAIVAPLLKIVLLVIGEAWRYSDEPFKLSVASRCIYAVQIVSKWACPDMFAYILLIYLMRSFDDAGNIGLVTCRAQLDVGFIYFSMFCIGSTLSSLTIRQPEQKAIADTAGTQSGPPLLYRILGRRGILPAQFCLLVAFLICFFIGVGKPSMALQVNSNAFIEPEGPLPASARPILNSLNLDEMLEGEVAVWACVLKMWEYTFHEEEVACAIGFIMMFVFALGLCIADMLVISYAAFKIHQSPEVGQQNLAGASRFLKHLEMLDVCVVGVIVVTAAGSMYKDMGVGFEFLTGIYLLGAAELIHYFSYFAVLGAVEYASERPVK